MMKIKGQSLVEVIIAIGILGVVLVGLVAGATTSLKVARVTRERSFAKVLADKKMEEVRSEKETNSSAFFALGNRQQTESDSSTEITYQVETTYTLSGANLMLVEVDVSWSDGSQTQNVIQNTILSRQ